MFLKEWEDRAAIEVHFAPPASREFVKKVRSLSDEAPVMKVFDAAPL